MENNITRIFKICSISLLLILCSSCRVNVSSNIPATKYNNAVSNANKWIYDKDKTEYFYTAEDEFLKIMQEDENDIQATISLGKLYKTMWEYDFRDNAEYFEKAINMFRKAEVLEPENSDVLTNLVELYYRKWTMDTHSKSYFDLTEEYCDKLLLFSNVTSEKSLTIEILCTIYEVTYNSDISNDELFLKTENAYRQYILISEDSSEIHIRLGNLYKLKWQNNTANMQYFDLAEDEYNIALEEYKYNDIAYEEIGNLYAIKWGQDRENQELYEKAIYYYKEAVSLSPDNETYTLNLINLEKAQ